MTTALVVGAGVISGDSDFHPLVDPVVPTWRPRDAVDGFDDG